MTIEKKTFPGYVLVRMDDDDNLLYEIRNTPSVIGFVGSGKYPAALSKKEVEKIIGNNEEIEDTKKEADKLMMNKIIKYENQLNEVKADNKKLAETVDRITHTPDNLRKKAVF